MNRVKTDDLLSLTGLRLGESAMRDAKLRKSSCAAGGECGIPDPGKGRYSPLLHWKTCHVYDWLRGEVGREVRSKMRDIYRVTARLIDVYAMEPVVTQTLFGVEEEIQSSRFGCIGCPAIGAEAVAPKSVQQRYGGGSPLNDLYSVWYDARQPKNRLIGFRKGKVCMGPVRMAVRMQLFARVLDIQRRAGVVLITPEDEAFIRRCWENKVYPNRWSEADEATPFPDNAPLFAE